MALPPAPEPTSADHSLGGAAAPLTLLEYGDYQCPHCALAHPTVHKLLVEFGDRIRFVFRHFPIALTHPQAKPAAHAAEAAGRQSNFWPVHELLFTHQHSLTDAPFADLARELGLDEAQFARDVASDTIHQKVEADFDGGMRSGVTGTPTFFINGQKYYGNHDHTTLRTVIEHELGKLGAGN
jgi:protein-disulfide isomerase